MDIDARGRLEEIEHFVEVWKGQCQEILGLVQTMKDKGVHDFGRLVEAHSDVECMEIWLDQVLTCVKKAAGQRVSP